MEYRDIPLKVGKVNRSGGRGGSLLTIKHLGYVFSMQKRMSAIVTSAIKIGGRNGSPIYRPHE